MGLLVGEMLNPAKFIPTWWKIVYLSEKFGQADYSTFLLYLNNQDYDK
jgi:hypothetical protein